MAINQHCLPYRRGVFRTNWLSWCYEPQPSGWSRTTDMEKVRLQPPLTMSSPKPTQQTNEHDLWREMDQLSHQGREATPNFDGTVKKVLVDPEPELDPTTENFLSGDHSFLLRIHKLARWPSVWTWLNKHWKTWSSKTAGQQTKNSVEGSLEPFLWMMSKHGQTTQAKEYLDSFHLQNGGFDLKNEEIWSYFVCKLPYKNWQQFSQSQMTLDNAVWVTDGAGNPLANNYCAHRPVGGKGRVFSETFHLEPEPKPNQNWNQNRNQNWNSNWT